MIKDNEGRGDNESIGVEITHKQSNNNGDNIFHI